MKWLDFDPEKRAYCTIAAAILGGSALSAGASIWGAQTASSAQQNIASQEIANANQIYGQNKAMLSPFVTGGTNALSQLTNWLNPSGTVPNATGGGSSGNPLSTLLSLVTPGANQNQVLSQTPGYQFAQSQGQRQIMNSLAGRGLGGAPGAITQDIGSFSSGLASTNYNNIVQQLLQTFGAGAGALQNVVNSGVSAGGAITGAGTGATTAINSALTGSGNAQAAAANATGAAGGTIGSGITTAALINSLTGGNNNGGVYSTGGGGGTVNG
jgi:hypothetical protein